MALSGTKALLVWSQRTTEGYKDVNVSNMQKSWKDGLAFCAILHHFRPDLIDFNSLSNENVRENNMLAFDVAEQELGIPALLDPEDMATMHVPDKLSIMTYVSQYYNYFKNKTPVKDVGGQKTRVPSKRPAGESPLEHVPKKQTTMGDSCAICGKKVYLVERQVADGKLYHRNCFRCTKCSTTLRPGGYKTTANPKQLECMEHGDNIWKLRSNIASRLSKEKKPPIDGGSGGIWETRPGAKPVASDTSREKRADAKPAPNAQPVLRDGGGVASILEARVGLKSVISDSSSAGSLWEKQSNAKPADPKPGQGKPALPTQKPQVPGNLQTSKTPDKPAVPMHPHLLASKASRERFNSPAAAQESKIVQPPHPSPYVSSPNLVSPEKKLNGDAAKTEATRQGLLASLAAVRGNSKPGTAASKEDLLDALEGNTGQKLAEGEEDSREASPAGSNWSLLSDAQQAHKDPSKDGKTNLEPSEGNESQANQAEPSETKVKSDPPNVDSQSRDSGHTSSDIFSLTSISSISQMGNSETSSLDTEHSNFASGIEPGKRSSAFSRASSSDLEGLTGTNLNLSDSFCMEYNTDKVEGDSDQDKEPNDTKTDNAKEDEKAAKEAPAVEKEGNEPENAKKYDESLNPFGDDDEEEEEVKKKNDGYKNPFDESDLEEDETYDDTLNPFGGDDDETTPGSPITQWPPPLPGVGSKVQEIPSQQGSYKVKTRQDILKEMQRDRHTLKNRQKRRAPPRPENLPPRPNASPDRPRSSIPQEEDPIKPPLRSRKSRPAPTPPNENGRPSEPKEIMPRPDKPPPPCPSSRDHRANSDVALRPVPSPRLKNAVLPDKDDGRISPVPSPRRKRSDGLKIDESESPVPSPRMRRATDVILDRKKIKLPRPTSDPVKQGSRKRAPAPPPIKREVDKHHVDPSIIQKELCEIEIQQRELETKGVTLEQNLRTDMEGKKGQDNEELLVEWFALVNEKNQILRREGELVAQAQMQELELQQAEIEYELRCLMHKHEHQKTDADVEREEKLLELLVEAVTKRSQIVERLEDDRKREEAEDEDIQIMMEQSGLDKKNMEKKKLKKKKGIGLLGK